MHQPDTTPTAFPDDLTDAEAAEYLTAFITEIWDWRDAGAFGRWTDTPTGRQWRVQRAELDARLDAQATGHHLTPRPTLERR